MTVQFGARWLELEKFRRPSRVSSSETRTKIERFMNDPVVQAIFAHTSDDIVLRFQTKDHNNNQVVLQINRPVSDIPEEYQKYKTPQQIVRLSFDVFEGDKRHTDAAKQWINAKVLKISRALAQADIEKTMRAL